MSTTRRFFFGMLGLVLALGVVLGIGGAWIVENSPRVRTALHLAPPSQIAQMSTKVEQLSDAGLSARINELNGRLATEESERKALAQRFSALEARLQNYESLRQDVTNLGESRDRIERDLAALTTSSNHLETSVRDLGVVKTTLATVEQDVANLKTKAREIDALKSEDARMKASINELAKSIVSFKADLGAIGSSGKLFSSRLAQLEKTLAQERASLMEVRTHVFVQGAEPIAGGERGFAEASEATPPRALQREEPHTTDAMAAAACDRLAKSQTDWERCMQRPGRNNVALRHRNRAADRTVSAGFKDF